MEIKHSTKGITGKGTSAKGNTKKGIKKDDTGGWWERRQSG
jgi:hypothetical protein